MTDQELQKLAMEYAEAMCPIEDYAKGDYIDLEERNIELDMYCDEAMDIIQWFAQSYCIVSREKLKKYNIAYRANSYSWVMLSKKDISDIFGSDLFEERSEK